MVILIVLLYFTVCFGNGKYSFTKIEIREFNASAIFKNEENEVSTETVGENDETITVTVNEDETVVDSVTNPNKEEVISSDETIGIVNSDETDNLNYEKALIETKETAFIYYVLVGFESLAIAFLYSYLSFSHFNKFSFKDIFRNKASILYFALYTILLAFSIYFVCDVYL